MNQSFDDFLKLSLTTPAALPDRAFVARVQARIALDEGWRALRRSMVRQLAQEIVAVGAIASAFIWMGKAAAVDHFGEQFPAAALALVLAAFGLLVLPLVMRPSSAH